jgi:hypothetical protein
MTDIHSTFVAVVRRRDHAGVLCTEECDGTYQAVSNDMIRCPLCGDTLPRWMTKSEYLSYQLPETEETLDYTDYIA